MRALVLGTAGHVDHGKTTLVRALTGTDTDRWKEEKRRGLTIDIGFARLVLTDDLEVGLVDVPGHEGFVKNMLAGATGIDLLLLVVAADEGPMPQTREHLAIARMLGIRQGVIALTKVDRVDREWLDLASEAAAEEVRTVLGVEWPVVEVSSTEGRGLDELRSAILAAASTLDTKRKADLLRVPVDRSFSIRGAGTVVTGTVWSGEVEVGDVVRLLPDGRKARVRAAQVHGEDRKAVAAGRRCALSLVGPEPGEVARGVVVVNEPEWSSVRRIGARICLLPFARREIEHGQRVRAYLGTSEAMVKVHLADRGRLVPGAEAWAVIEAETPIVCRARDRFVLRFYSPVTTIGGGEVADLEPPSMWHQRTADWETILDGAPVDAVSAAIRLGAALGVRYRRLPLVTGLSPDDVASAVSKLASAVLRIGDRIYPMDSLADAMDQTREALSRIHAERRRERGVSLESLRTSVARASSPDLAAEAVKRLAADGVLVVEGPLARLSGHEPILTEEEKVGLGSVMRELHRCGVEPPAPEDLARRLGLDRGLMNDLVRLLVDEGGIVAVSPGMLLSRESLDEALATVGAVLETSSPASPAEFREALGTSRRYLIPLLEYFDREGVTQRTPEGRVRGPGQST